jgi:hypothetical protein
MRIIHRIGDYPLHLLVACALMFSIWVTRDLSATQPTPSTEATEQYVEIAVPPTDLTVLSISIAAPPPPPEAAPQERTEVEVADVRPAEVRKKRVE